MVLSFSIVDTEERGKTMILILMACELIECIESCEHSIPELACTFLQNKYLRHIPSMLDCCWS